MVEGAAYRVFEDSETDPTHHGDKMNHLFSEQTNMSTTLLKDGASYNGKNSFRNGGGNNLFDIMKNVNSRVNDNIDKFGVKKGETVTAHVDIQSREYNGRWYTDVKAWKISRDQPGGVAAPASDDEPWPEPPADAGDGDDGLPF